MAQAGRRTLRRAASALALAAGVLLVGAVAAQAATLQSDGTRVTYTAAPGEANDVLVTEDYDFYSDDERLMFRVFDYGATITALPPCTVDSAGTGYCPIASVTKSTFLLGDGDDFMRGDVDKPKTDMIVDGGPGNDSLSGGPGNDVIRGGPGNDKLEETFYNYGRSCGAGVHGGADDVSGGDGVDWLVLACRSDDRVNASLDDVANDGAQGEGDNYRSDLENVDGGNGGTNFVGTNGPNVFKGGDSADTADARGGNDELWGSCGVDRLNGGPGDDFINGGCDGDILDGGPGKDTVEGDEVCHGYGNCTGGGDVIHVRDGFVDNVKCGIGADVVIADRVDLVASDFAENCESVKLPAAATKVPKQCRKLSGKKQKVCIKRAAAIAKCKKKHKGSSKQAKRKRAACIRKAKRIG